ncbi:ComEA family DNA-binding protein [Dyadobacter luticola]|uniref:Helix-hairpin-helix domain-containing protein n=1 Tax=Dyadobacter luticola TaxID=1979387 RepID=A0A5R9KV23_9BACT|nr:helix-hairpin-helix domain-containing protein [Dyadobacter luticola]TLV00018.1 helix-hairpin-helix domain-containing protein [Dyadobacter luticola]
MQRYLKIAYASKPAALVLTLAFIPRFIFAQEPPRKEIDINQFIADLFPVPADDNDNSELYESLYQLYASPLDLNVASRDELSNTLILSEKQLNSFFEYREKLGALLSLYELQAVPGFDLETIRRLLPFVTVNPAAVSLGKSLKNPSQHFLMFRTSKILETQKGFSPVSPDSQSRTRYEGSPFNGYLRYRNARSGFYSFGITLEKDAGEKFWDWSGKRQVYGIDYTSFHAQIMNRGKLKNLILGDFQMQAGQGMVLGSGFSLGKGSEVIKTVYRSTLGMKPYTSALEANFMRGIAATYVPIKQLETTLFYSRVKRDASQDDSPEKIMTSLPVTGYHRTPTEREKHNVLTEQNVGLHVLYKLSQQKGQVGLTVLNTHYGSLIRKRAALYNHYEFSGTQNWVAGFHGDYRFQNLHFFGEGAISKSRGTGAVAGIIAGMGRRLDISLLFRHYDRDFHTFYGNAFSESSRPINETGAYFGLRYALTRRWQFSGYCDFFKFPWLKYQIDAASQGHDYYLHMLWKPSKRLNAYILFHEKHKQANDPGSEEAVAPLITTVRRTAMFNLEYERPLRFSIRTRFQCGDFNYQNISRSKGLTIAQDISWHFPRVELSARLAWFNSDDYDSRQYVYEKDVLYAFSLPAYYDVGTRHYLMLRYNLTKKMKVWLRWSQTRYKDLEKISSGLNEIDGSRRSELKTQLMYQF